MKKRPPNKSDPVNVLRQRALQYPEAEEGIACEGTSLEKRTIRVRNKAFLFLGPVDAMLKLRESLAEATELAAREPSRFKVGAHGWVTITLAGVNSLPPDVLARWIGESYRLFAPKQMLVLNSTDESTVAAPTNAPRAKRAKAKSKRA